jgi:acyl-CoA thioesterase-1
MSVGWALGLALGLSACEDGRDPDGTPPPSQPEQALESPEEEPQSRSDRSTIRGVFLGTSLTAGYGLEDPLGESWPGRVQALADRAGVPLEVVNAGVSGETSAGGLARLDWILREPLDLLVVELGANDGLRGQDPAALASNLNQILRRTRTRYPEVRLVLAQMEAPPNLGAEYTEAFREVYGRVADEQGAALMPFLLEGVAGDPALNQADGIHPTAEGHEVMARLAWETIGPIVEEVARPLRR